MTALLARCLPRWQCSTMKAPVLTLLLLRCLVAGRKDSSLLSELPLSELLAQKKAAESRGAAVASAFVGEAPQEEMRLKRQHGVATRRTFYEDDYDDGKSHPSKKKHEDKMMHDLLNTSIMALSYLAFGGYLLCMIASALREKKRRYAMGYPPVGPTMSNQLAQVLQQFGQRPSRPFTRFPTVTVHQGGRRRRRRSLTDTLH